jgi:predicted membrane-bound mannosyltransferase
LLVLPALALLALRCLALAVAGRTRRLALALFAVAALNACCWALITPVFQGPDEVDHFAYTQSLVERGEKPVNDPQAPVLRWSSAERLALEGTSFLTDHQVGDTRAPWLAAQVREYEAQVRRLRPSRSDGGGYTTSAAHGHASVFSQLTLMRIVSALLGALVVLFTFLLGRELAPRRPWLAVLAALLVAYEPMYGFVSGIVNNDVGVNATAAALELLLIRLLRRGVTIPWGALTGAVLILLPSVKGTGLSL